MSLRPSVYPLLSSVTPLIIIGFAIGIKIFLSFISDNANTIAGVTNVQPPINCKSSNFTSVILYPLPVASPSPASLFPAPIPLSIPPQSADTTYI